MKLTTLIIASALSFGVTAQPKVDLRPDLVNILYAAHDSITMLNRMETEPQLKTIEYLACYQITGDEGWAQLALDYFNNGLVYEDSVRILERVMRIKTFKKVKYQMREIYRKPSFLGPRVCGDLKGEIKKFSGRIQP